MTIDSKEVSGVGKVADGVADGVTKTDEAALADLYREAVINHAVNSVGYQLNIDATHRYELHNPLCGDRVEMQFRVNDEAIEAAAFDGDACAICMASASMLCESMPGHSVAHLSMHHDWLEDALKTKASERQDQPGLEALRALLAVRHYPARIRCALLPWQAAIKALKKPG